MNWFKRDFPLRTALLLSVLSIGFEGWLLQQTSRQSAQAIAGLEQKKHERDGLQRQAMPPTEENEQAIIRELAMTGEKLAALETTLNGAVAAMTAASGQKPVDAYFEIADFIEKSRGLAAQARVTLRPDERFGFSSHRTEGDRP